MSTNQRSVKLYDNQSEINICCVNKSGIVIVVSTSQRLVLPDPVSCCRGHISLLFLNKADDLVLNLLAETNLLLTESREPLLDQLAVEETELSLNTK